MQNVYSEEKLQTSNFKFNKQNKNGRHQGGVRQPAGQPTKLRREAPQMRSEATQSGGPQGRISPPNSTPKIVSNNYKGKDS